MIRPGKFSSRPWDRFRRTILDRDGWRCQRCGGARRLEVHHIQERHKRPDLLYDAANCITRCQPCHAHEHPPILPADVAAWRFYIVKEQSNDSQNSA